MRCRWLLAGALITLAGAGCGSGTDSGENPAAAGARTLTDQDGTTIELPAHPKVAASIGAYAQIIALVGGENQLVASIPGLSDMFHTVWPDANAEGYDSSNVEEVIASGADVIVGPSFTDEEKTQLEAAGVEPFVIDTFASVDDMKNVVSLIADVVGGTAPEVADEFAAYYDGNIEYVRERTASVPADQRVRLLNLRMNAGAYSTVTGADISAAYATAAGADFVSQDVTAEGISTPIDAEQVIAWAPQVIFTMGTDTREAIVADPALATVPAIADGKVFVEPAGTYPWSVRSAEGALAPLFLATILYPEIFTELSLADETKEFYQQFYDYTLTDDEVALILAGSLW
ncbi:MAG: ABC transporter substrate-binding protein [Rhodococcus sp. (in: high G+C Gram-positive bacteria)]|uniref:ABC transporter substrate-binding protein n=1 Tax=Rhodococcus sp. TaxID=1831 RepID=UPI003BB7AC79